MLGYWHWYGPHCVYAGPLGTSGWLDTDACTLTFVWMLSPHPLLGLLVTYCGVLIKPIICVTDLSRSQICCRLECNIIMKLRGYVCFFIMFKMWVSMKYSTAHIVASQTKEQFQENMAYYDGNTLYIVNWQQHRRWCIASNWNCTVLQHRAQVSVALPVLSWPTASLAV